jgi:LAO/AO transport system kinase
LSPLQQGIKTRYYENADAIVINKADGDNIRKAKLATEFNRALHLFPAKDQVDSHNRNL